MKFISKIKFFVLTAWSLHSRRSCLQIFACQFICLVCLFCIGFIYVHVYVPNYNARRLSKTPLVCSSISDEKLEQCELPWNHSNITIDYKKNNLHHKLYEEDGLSVSVSLQRSDIQNDTQSNRQGQNQQGHQDVTRVSERHFNWSSCGEFCEDEYVDKLGCRQLRVDVRNRGTAFRLVGCSKIRITDCGYLKVGVNPEDESTAHVDGKKEWIEIENHSKKLSPPCFPESDTSCLHSGLFECHAAMSQDSANLVQSKTTPKPLQSTVSSPKPIILPTLKPITISSTPQMTTTSNGNDTVTVTSTQAPILASSAPSPHLHPSTTPISSIQVNSPTRHRRAAGSGSLYLKCTNVYNVLNCDVNSLYNPSAGGGGKRFNCTPSSAKNEECFNTSGIYICDSSFICTHIPKPESICSRHCDNKIRLDDSNTIITTDYFGRILTANCEKAMLQPNNNLEVWPHGIKHMLNKTETPSVIMTCNKLKTTLLKHSHEHDGRYDISVSDCLNGTRLENTTLPDSASITEIQEMWHEAMKTEDFLLDPIKQMYAPPESNLEVYRNVPLYFNDFYKESKNGCELPPTSSEYENECSDFYMFYGRTKNDLRGQALFPCFCRHIHKTTYCVIGGSRKGSRDIFEHYWEDGLVDFIQDYHVLLLVFFTIIFVVSFVFTAVLLYPLITDMVGYSMPITPTSLAPSPFSISGGAVLNGKRGTATPKGSSPAVKGQEGRRRSRSNSIVSAMG